MILCTKWGTSISKPTRYPSSSSKDIEWRFSKGTFSSFQMTTQKKGPVALLSDSDVLDHLVRIYKDLYDSPTAPTLSTKSLREQQNDRFWSDFVARLNTGENMAFSKSKEAIFFRIKFRDKLYARHYRRKCYTCTTMLNNPSIHVAGDCINICANHSTGHQCSSTVPRQYVIALLVPETTSFFEGTINS